MENRLYGDLSVSKDNMTGRHPIRPVTVRQYHPRLRQMFRDAIISCKEKLKDAPPIETDGVYCNRTIDGMGGCWPDTLPGTYARIRCPDIPVFNQHAFAYKECTVNGTWYENKTTGFQSANYSQCRIGPDTFHEDTRHIYIFIGGFSLSIAMLLISLTIFFRFRQLRCDRITIHKNLFLSYVLTGVAWVLYYVFVALDGHIILQNPIWCQALHVICQYFKVCNFMWMFCEGLYLNTRMVYAFATGKSLIASCYCCGWGLPLMLAVVYASVRGNDISNTDCWINESDLQWIMNGPVVLSIVINVLFLINIVRLLITKLREMPEVAQTRKAARAILILIPLLGLQYLLFPVRPEPYSDLEDLYHIVVALVVSLQGAFVSIIYCFCNGEVIALLRRKYRQHRLMTTRSLHRSSSGHGITTYTEVNNIGDGADKANATNKVETVVRQLRSKLHLRSHWSNKQHSQEIQLETFQPTVLTGEST